MPGSPPRQSNLFYLRSSGAASSSVGGLHMKKFFLAGVAAVAAAVAFLPAVTRAQSFHVEKFDIKGDGGTDYVAVESATGRVFVSRGTHVMVVDGATGNVLGDIQNTPGVHGAGLATAAGH